MVSDWYPYPAFHLNIVGLYVVATNSAFAVNISNSLAVNINSLQATTYALMW